MSEPDIPALIERLESFADVLNGDLQRREAALALQAQAAEIERLQEENADWQQAADVEARERKRAHTKLREAVEFLRPIITSARYESGGTYVVRIPDDTVHQARAFLATMEKQEDSTSE